MIYTYVLINKGLAVVAGYPVALQEEVNDA